MNKTCIISVNSLLVSLLAASPGIADSRLDVLEPVQSSLDADWEKWKDRTQVSGGIKVGVMANSHGQGIVNLQRAKLYLPAMTEEILCVELTSHDGRYSASLEFALEGIAPGWHLLKIPTDLQTKLGEYSTTQLVVLANVAEKCGSGAGKYLPIDWDVTDPVVDQSIFDVGSIQIFLNSRVPTSIRLVGSDGELTPCKEQTGPRTSFNLLCDVPIGDEMDQRLTILMRRGRSVKQIPLELWLRE